MNFLAQCFYAGCDRSMNVRLRMRLQTMNAIYICIILMTIGLSCWATARLDVLNTVLSLLYTVLSSIVIFANHRRLYNTATLFHLLISGTPSLIFSYLFGFRNGFYLYTLAAPISMMTFLDMDNKKQLFSSSAYYLIIFVMVFVLHQFELDNIKQFEYNPYVLFINLLLTATIIFMLAYNFYLGNKLYLNQIKKKNTALTEKNEEISELVSVLNDKVKNNLQVMSVFTDFDSSNPPATDIAALLRLHKSRIKVLTLCYRVIFEDKEPNTAWLRIFLNHYYIFFKNLYLGKISDHIVIEDHTDSQACIPRKRFETLTSLLNEWHFKAIESVNDEFDEPFKIRVDLYEEDTENDSQKYRVSIKLIGKGIDNPTLDKNLNRLAHLRNFTITSYVQTDPSAHELSIIF